MFVPFEEGWEIGCGDYVQAEAVIVAYLSKDEPLINSIIRGNGLRDALRNETNPKYIKIIKSKLKEVDIHRTKAMELFNVSNEDVTKDQRFLGKQTRHATNYISGPRVLQAFAAQGEIYQPIAFWKKLMAIDEAKSPAKYKWHKAIVDELSEKKKILSNPFGRHRKFLGEWNEDLFKVGCAFKPQSTIGDLLNEGMTIFYNKWIDKIRLLLQLHDGMYISYPKEERGLWLGRLRKAMEIEIEVNGRLITVDVEMKAGPNWGDLEDVNF
jgi:DNA polymerase I-like protein with 3'-5' exonuclease and polymerase domains